MTTSPEDFDATGAVLMFEKTLAQWNADPLAQWKPMSTEQERILQELGRGEILDGAANEAGKTTIGATVITALAQGRHELGGYQLPAIPQPSAWVVATLDFTQQQLSVQPKYLSALGTWPHKPKWDGETLRSLRVRYIGCRDDDPKHWSRITFVSAKNLATGTGFRGNGYHCDEPPPMWLLRELRKMGEANSVHIGLITATMLKRHQWYPLRPDYPLAYEGRWHGMFLRLRAPAFNPDDLDDYTVGNRALTRQDKERLLALYANDPDWEARILGKEIDTENSSPFRQVLDEMQRQLDAARDGVESEWKVSREVPTRHGKELVTETVLVESWDVVKPGHVYRVIVDSSLGIDDGKHDPCKVDVYDMTDRAQMVRYNGYIGEYGSGVLAGGLSKKWNNAFVRVATTGGYGDTCLSGLRAVGCRNIDTRQIKTPDGGIDRTDIGYKEDAGTRMAHVGALLEVFGAARAGSPYFTLRSRADIAELMDLTFDDKNRVVTGPGLHDEALSVCGEAAVLCSPEKRTRYIPPRAQRVPESPIDIARRDAGLPPRRREAVAVGVRAPVALPKARRRWR